MAAAQDVRLRTRRGALGSAPPDGSALAALDEANGSSDPKEKEYSAEYKACTSAAHGFTTARADCYSTELSRQGARLNRAFETAMAARSGDQKTRLLQAQRAWIRLRDSRCQDDEGGSASDVLHQGSCRLEMTVRRAVELEHMAS